LAVLVALNALSRAGRLPGPSGFWNLFPFEAGMCSISMAGVVASILFFKKGVADSLGAKARLAMAYAAVLFVAGLLLAPLGISKNHDTPTWCLFSSAANTVMFLGLYWIADVKHRTSWAAFVKPAGSNTLLTYLLPDVWYTIPFLAAIGGRWPVGWPGVVYAVAFTAMILAVSAVLTRAKLRLQL
jgi:heparan-alpha-glucosaminide N-acetyltransferase